MPTGDNPVTLGEIYSYIIKTNLHQAASAGVTLGELLLALGSAIEGYGGITGNTFAFPSLHRALANVQAGVAGDRKIGLIGDSTTYGYNGVNGIGAAQSLAQLMTSAGYTSALGMTIPPNPLNAGVDTRWSVGTGWTQGVGKYVWGGLATMYIGAAGTAANTLTFTPSGGYSYDTFDVWYLTGIGFGGFDAAIDSAAATTTNSSAAAGIAKVTLSGSAGTSHVIKIGNVTTNSVFIIGIEPSLSTTPKVRVANLGVIGSLTGTWVDTTRSPQGPLNCIASYAADAWIINLGINDADSGVSEATYLTNLLTLVNACKATGDVVVTSVVPSGVGGTGNPSAEALLVSGLRAFCLANGCGYLDIWTAWGGLSAYTELNPLGYYYDFIHPSQNVGYPDLAGLMARTLLSA